MHDAQQETLWATADMYEAIPRAMAHVRIAPLARGKLEPPVKSCGVLRLNTCYGRGTHTMLFLRLIARSALYLQWSKTWL